MQQRKSRPYDQIKHVGIHPYQRPRAINQLDLVRDEGSLHDKCDRNSQKRFDFLQLPNTLLPLRDPSNRVLSDQSRYSIL